MLEFKLNQEKDSFIINFVVPVDKDSCNHKDFKLFSEIFIDKYKCTFDYENDHITAISGKLEFLVDIADQWLTKKEAAVQKLIIDELLTKNFIQKEGLQVNFHQNPFDNSFRYWNFILNQGSFLRYFYNRVNWFIAPKYNIVTPFPLHVDIESSSTCNMNCPMCYRDQLKETGQMDYGLFKKIVDECADNNVFSIRLSWRGETLTHPKITDMIAYACNKITNVSFLTNAFYIDDRIAECCIDNKVSYLAISFDGIGNVYESIRHPAKFKENYNRIANLKRKRDEKKSDYPQIRLCTIWPAIKMDPKQYTRTMKSVSDYIVCNPYINFKGPMVIKPDFICQYPWERIVIAFNGKAQCCTGWNADDIILENVTEKSIVEMWNSDHMTEVRNLHKQGNRMSLNSCANCRHGSKGDPDINIWDILKRQY